jgi:hypothetical protein
VRSRPSDRKGSAASARTVPSAVISVRRTNGQGGRPLHSGTGLAPGDPVGCFRCFADIVTVSATGRERPRSGHRHQRIERLEADIRPVELWTAVRLSPYMRSVSVLTPPWRSTPSCPLKDVVSRLPAKASLWTNAPPSSLAVTHQPQCHRTESHRLSLDAEQVNELASVDEIEALVEADRRIVRRQSLQIDPVERGL